MASTNQIVPGMTISIDGDIYRVESAVKVTVPKGTPFTKTKLKNLITDDVIEKSFKAGQSVQEVALSEKKLEFLYPEGKSYLFLDVGSLDQVLIGGSIIADKVHYLKEGIEIKALFYGSSVFSVELPQFLELMVLKTEGAQSESPVANAVKVAIIETGARIEVPLFIESGDIIKIDTQLGEYIQRV